MNKEKLLSSKSNEWETPKDLFEKLNKEWNFTLDPSCRDYNATCLKYYTMETDGLSKSWEGETAFCNPPYGQELGRWIKKCSEEGEHATVVMLVPSRTDTKAMQEYCLNKAKAVCFVKGRLKFINRLFPSWREDGNFKVSPAPFPSLLAVFGTENLTEGQIKLLNSLGHTMIN
ncbi:DNA N-6-adenine-methyltransferase [Robertmurraya siralis]|uniref:DNA N-6-adenine-methyltransferase n=1 Tax=Robertmurraya siralis TaxID=77777 RepID=UPI0010F8E240|nr:DNA N-6-adenine-methyltransferase [Robertmurraya siralis]